MSDAIGNAAGAAPGGVNDDANSRSHDEGLKAKAFEKILSQFAMQIVETDIDDMNQTILDTEDDSA